MLSARAFAVSICIIMIASSLAPVAGALIPADVRVRPYEWNPSLDPIFKHKEDGPISTIPIKWPLPLDYGYPTVKPLATTGTIENIVIMVDFNDTTGTKTKASYTSLLFSNTTGSMDHYYWEVSYGKTLMNGSVACTGWQRSAKNMTWYGADQAPGHDNKNGNIFELAREAMTLADGCINYSQYDKDADNILEPGDVNIIVVHAGNDQAASGSGNDIWSHRWVIGTGTTTLDGVRVSGWDTAGYVMLAENSPMGTFAHETGHSLGLPDLYDTDYSSVGVGDWDLMAGGSWNGAPAGSSPAHLSAWSKVTLGWITPTVIAGNVYGQQVPTFETCSTSVFKLPMSALEYFLITNVEKTGYDTYLKASGIMIWHIDDALSSNTNENHKMVDIEEDGGTGYQDLDHAGGASKADDVWVNNLNGFSPSSTPNSTAYNGSNSNWAVTNISVAGSNMTVDITRSSAWIEDAYVTLQDAVVDGFFERAQVSYNVDSNIANDNVKVQMMVYDYPGGFLYSNNDSYVTNFQTVDYRSQTWSQPSNMGNHRIVLLLKDSGGAVVDTKEFLNVWLENNNGGTNEWFKSATYITKDTDVDTANETLSPTYDVDNPGGSTTVSVQVWIYYMNGTWAANVTDGYAVTGTANDPRTNIDWSTPKTQAYNVYLRLNDSLGNVEQELYWPNILLGMLESIFASVSLQAQNMDGHGFNDTAILTYNVDTTGPSQGVNIKTEIWNATVLVRTIWDNYTVMGPGANSSDTKEQQITMETNDTFDFHVYLYNNTKLMDEFHNLGIFLEVRNFAPAYIGGLNTTYLREDQDVWNVSLDSVFYDYEDDGNLTFTTNKAAITINSTHWASWAPKGTDGELFNVNFTAWDAHNGTLNGTSVNIDLRIDYLNDWPEYKGNLTDTSVFEDTTWKVNLKQQFFDEESQVFLMFTCNKPEITIEPNGNTTWAPKEGASSLTNVIFQTRDPLNSSMTVSSPPITLTFVPVNDKPVYLGGLYNDTVLEDHEWTANLKSMWTDEEDPTTISFSSSYPAVTIDTAGIAHWTPTNNSTSLVNLTFTAIDGKDASVTNNTRPITLVFQWVNDKPTFTGNLNDSEVYEDTVWSIKLDNLFTDEEDPAGLNFTCTSDQIVLDIANKTATWSPVDGDYSLKDVVIVALDAQDPSLKASSNVINLTFVPVNERPVFLGGLEGANVTEGTRWYVDLNDYFDDEETGQTLVFTCNYEEIDINPSTDWAIWEPDEGAESLMGVVFTATDGNSDTPSEPIDLIFVPLVKPVPTPPTVTITAPKDGSTVKAKVTISGSSLDLDGNVTKVEVRIDSYSWETTTLKDPVKDVSTGGWSRAWTYSWDTSKVSNGDHDISVKAKDNEELVGLTVTIGVTVKNIIPPVPLLDVPADVETGEEVTIKATRSTGDIAGYFFTFGDGQDSGWVDTDTVTHKYSSASTFTVKLVLKDPEGTQSETVTKTITVKAPYVPPPPEDEKKDEGTSGMLMGAIILIIVIVAVIALAAWVMRPSEKEKLMRMQVEKERRAKARGGKAQDGDDDLYKDDYERRGDTGGSYDGGYDGYGGGGGDGGQGGYTEGEDADYVGYDENNQDQGEDTYDDEGGRY